MIILVSETSKTRKIIVVHPVLRPDGRSYFLLSLLMALLNFLPLIPKFESFC